MITEEIINGEKWMIVKNDEIVLRGNSHAVLRGNSHAVLWENSHAELWENSHAVLRGNSHALLWENSHAELWENSHAELWENSHALLWGNSHAELRGNSHAVLWGNSHAELWENSHALLWGNSHALLWGNSHAELRENSHAELRENSHALLRDFSVVHKKSKTVKINKGKRATVIIPNYPSKMTDWAKMKNIKIKNGKMLLWKAVTKDGMDFRTRKISYLKKAIAPDWNKLYPEECGKGLHLADSPSGARCFISRKEFRLIQVSAKVEDCICFPGNPQYPMKIRARACNFVKEFPPDYIEEFKEVLK